MGHYADIAKRQASKSYFSIVASTRKKRGVRIGNYISAQVGAHPHDGKPSPASM